MFAQLDQFGMDTHASTHAVEEEFWINPAANVSAQLVTGTELLVLSVQILKFGLNQDLLVFVLTETGMVSLVLNVPPIKFGSQPL